MARVVLFCNRFLEWIQRGYGRLVPALVPYARIVLIGEPSSEVALSQLRRLKVNLEFEDTRGAWIEGSASL